MIITGVSEEELSQHVSGFPMIVMYFWIPEIIIGSCAGWYLGEWITEKIENYE